MSKMKWHAPSKARTHNRIYKKLKTKYKIKYKTKTYITNNNIVYYNQNPKPNKSIKPNQNKKIWVPN